MRNFHTLGLFLSGLFLIFSAVSCKEEVEPPEASFTYSPEPANTEDPVTFEAEESYPGSCDNCFITDYYWDFDNDGEWDEITDNSTIIHQFNSSNIYEVVLQVRNNQGYTSVEYATQSVEVQTGSGGGDNGDGVVSLSFPPDGGSDVSLLPRLNWSVDDDSQEWVYDVYLGTSENPGLEAESLENSSYTPPDSLEKSTTYYWRVEAYDDNGDEESSPTWEFTTQETDEETNKPPNKPTAPYPESLSENRSINPFLEWSCSDPNGDELTYEVYFGTSENPTLVEADYSDTQFEPGTLSENTTYYWKIIAIDPDEETAESELWHFTTGSQDPSCPSSFTDERNDKTYKAVQVGVQCWMAENLDYGEILTGGQATDNNTTEKFCYQDNENNCDEYGGLYQWDELMQYTQVEEVGGICPDGWHVPSENEWHYLVDYLGGNFAAGKRLKEGGSSGFEALLAGTRNTSSSYEDLNLNGYYWASTQLDSDDALQIQFKNDRDGVYYSYKDKGRASSVRCVKN